MMGVPVPAVLAAIALLLWPAGRLYAVLAARRALGDRFAPAPRLSLGEGLRRQLPAVPVFSSHVMLLAVVLAIILLFKLIAHRIFGAQEPLIFGTVSLDSLFDFAMLLEFAVFAFQSAVDTHRATRGQAARVETSAGGMQALRRSSLLDAATRLQAELVLYGSTGAALLVIIFVTASFFALMGAGPHIPPG